MVVRGCEHMHVHVVKQQSEGDEKPLQPFPTEMQQRFKLQVATRSPFWREVLLDAGVPAGPNCYLLVPDCTKMQLLERRHPRRTN